MSADRVMAYLRSVPKPPKKNKKIIENPLTNPTECGIMNMSRGQREERTYSYVYCRRTELNR